MIFFFISLVTYFCFIILKSRKALLILEKDKYDLKKFKKWIFTKENFVTLELLSIFLIVISIYHDDNVTGICTLILYMFLSLLFIKNIKEKFKLSKKSIKIIVPAAAIYLITFGLIITDYLLTQTGYIMHSHITIYYLIVIIIGYINYIIILFAVKVSIKAKKGKKTKTKQNHKLK